MKKQYCTQLVNPPVARKSYKNPAPFYHCRITDKACIAKENKYNDEKSRGLFARYDPVIDQETLPSCPAWNITKKLGKSLLEARLKKELQKKRQEVAEKLKRA